MVLVRMVSDDIWAENWIVRWRLVVMLGEEVSMINISRDGLHQPFPSYMGMPVLLTRGSVSFPSLESRLASWPLVPGLWF